MTARRFYHDTVCHGSRPALTFACGALGTDTLLPGSDYPVLFRPYAESFSFIRDAGIPGWR